MSAQRLTTTDLHWAAGFLEGEGSFGNGGAGIGMNASQVQKEPLEKLQRLFGGNLHLDNTSIKHPNHQNCWHWTLVGRAGAAIMMTLYVLMSTRRKQQIEKYLTVWKATKSRPGRKYRGVRYLPREGHRGRND
jgi:hypothetical protein